MDFPKRREWRMIWKGLNTNQSLSAMIWFEKYEPLAIVDGNCDDHTIVLSSDIISNDVPEHERKSMEAMQTV